MTMAKQSVPRRKAKADILGSKTSLFGRLAILRASIEKDSAELKVLCRFLETAEDHDPDLARQIGNVPRSLEEVIDLLTPNDPGHVDQELPPELWSSHHDRALNDIGGDLAKLVAMLRCAVIALDSSEDVDRSENAASAR